MMAVVNVSASWLVGLATCALAFTMAAASADAAGPDDAVDAGSSGPDLPANHAIISRQASERATAGIDNKIATLGERTHVVWQDSTEEGYLPA